MTWKRGPANGPDVASPAIDRYILDMTHTTDPREASLLAGYAFPSARTRGRVYAETEHPYRSPYQRDRDRILHSAAFRRLSGKMQVFTGDHGDYHRTRLTHTMEVASIARTIGRALRLNEDLIESLALLHDLGHPPFGHAGEDVLDDYLKEEGGFSHNQFALTLVETLEQRYPSFPGLNLSRELLDGQRARANKAARTPVLLEVQVVDAADSIAYNAHDLDDAIKLGWIQIEELTEVPLADESVRHAIAMSDEFPSRLLRQVIVRDLVERQVTSVLNASLAFLSDVGWSTPEEAMASDFKIQPEPEVARLAAGFQAFLYKQVYRHERLLEMRRRAQTQLTELVECLADRPDQIPAHYQYRVEQVGARRAAVEYVAGMTDRFCQQHHEHLVG